MRRLRSDLAPDLDEEDPAPALAYRFRPEREAAALADQVTRRAKVEPDDTSTPGDAIVTIVVKASGLSSSCRISETLMAEIEDSEGVVVRALMKALRQREGADHAKRADASERRTTAGVPARTTGPQGPKERTRK